MLVGHLHIGVDQRRLIGLRIKLDRLSQQVQVLVVAAGSEGSLGVIVVEEGLVLVGHGGADLGEHLVRLAVASGVEVDVRPKHVDIRALVDPVGQGLGHLVDGRVLRCRAEDVLSSRHSLDQVPIAADRARLARLDRADRDPTEVVPQVEIGGAELVVQHGALHAQSGGCLIRLGGQGEGVSGQVDVAELVVVGGALRIELDGLLVVPPGLFVLTAVELGFGQHVVGGIVVAVLQQRFEHTDDVVPSAAAGVDLGQHLARLHVVGGRLEDLFEDGLGLLVVARVAVRPGQVEPVAGLRAVGGHGLLEQLDGLLVLRLKEGVAPVGEELFRPGAGRVGCRCPRIGIGGNQGRPEGQCECDRRQKELAGDWHDLCLLGVDGVSLVLRDFGRGQSHFRCAKIGTVPKLFFAPLSRKRLAPCCILHTHHSRYVLIQLICSFALPASGPSGKLFR